MMGTVDTYLQHHLRNLHRMAGGTCTVDDSELGGPANRVSDVIAMIRTIEIFAVPASAIIRTSYSTDIQLINRLQWEDNIGPNTSRTWLIW